MKSQTEFTLVGSCHLIKMRGRLSKEFRFIFVLCFLSSVDSVSQESHRGG